MAQQDHTKPMPGAICWVQLSLCCGKLVSKATKKTGG